MEKAASHNQSAGVFFCTLSAFPAFFRGLSMLLYWKKFLRDVFTRHHQQGGISSLEL
jgi:hypothetical protein